MYLEWYLKEQAAGEKTLEETVVELLAEKGFHITTAESCTGGMIAGKRALTALAARGLRQLPGVEVFTGPGQSGVLSFRCRDLDCEEAAARLAEAGIAVRAGLHCAPMAHRSGGTLETGTVRVSFSAFNTSAEVRQFLQVCRTAFLPG